MSNALLIHLTSGGVQNHQMNNSPKEFSARLDAALAMNGMTNAEFAARVNPSTGHQTVNGWRKRGKIGGPSLPQVRAILAVTSMEWLQEGTGAREKHGVGEVNVKYYPPDMSTSSHNSNFNAAMLSVAETWVRFEEEAVGELQPLRRAERLISLYQMVEADGGSLKPASAEKIISDVRRITQKQGVKDAKKRSYYRQSDQAVPR